MPEQKSLRAYELIRLRAGVKGHGGFTLLELIITIAIIAVLLFALVLVLDPLELIAQARDTRRVSDLEAMSNAIDIAKAELVGSSGTWDPDGNYDGDGDMNTDEGCAGEDNQTVFVSVVGTDASGTCASPPDDLPTGWSYRCAPIDGPQDIDGTGWLPIDLTAGGTVNAPISHLPTDSVSTFASGHYYTYVCDRSSRGFEITARMASKKHRTGGSDDIQSTDGGIDPLAFEIGTDLSLAPFVNGLTGYWPFDEGSGASTADLSGYGNNGTFNNTPAWTTSCKDGDCLTFVRTDSDYIDFGNVLNIGTNSWSISFWVNSSSFSTNSLPISKKASEVCSSSADDGYRIRRMEDVYEFSVCEFGSGTNWAATPTFDTADGNWHHIVAVWSREGNSLTVYLDGEPGDPRNAFSNDSFDGPENLCFGGQCATGNYFDGILDEIYFYNRALSADEIKGMYDAFK